MLSRITKALLYLSLLFSGVTWASPDIAVINLSNEKVHYPQNSSWRQMVVLADSKSTVFTTLVKAEQKPASFILTVYDFSAKRISESRIPEFTGGPGSAWEYALSPDSSKIVYRKGESLNLMDIATKTSSTIWEGAVSKYGMDISVFWLSDHQFVVVIDKDEDRSRNEISVFDISTMQRKVLYRPLDVGRFSIGLSADKKFLAFAESLHRRSIDKAIRILNLENGEILATVGNGTQLIGPVTWSPDGDELAYVEGHEIKVWRREDQRIRRLTEARKDFLIYYVFFAKGRIGYIGGDLNRNYSGFLGLFGGRDLIVIDSITGKKLQKFTEQFNGSIFYVEAANSVIAEIGY